jgi:hypothetical protein
VSYTPSLVHGETPKTPKCPPGGLRPNKAAGFFGEASSLRAGFGPSSNASRSDKRRRQQARAGPSPDACCCRSYTFCNAEQRRHGEADRPCAMAVLISPKRLPATRCPPRGQAQPDADRGSLADRRHCRDGLVGWRPQQQCSPGLIRLAGLALHPAGWKKPSSECRLRSQQRSAQLARRPALLLEVTPASRDFAAVSPERRRHSLTQINHLVGRSGSGTCNSGKTCPILTGPIAFRERRSLPARQRRQRPDHNRLRGVDHG